MLHYITLIIINNMVLVTQLYSNRAHCPKDGERRMAVQRLDPQSEEENPRSLDGDPQW